ncbi:sphingomyelin phosphodiesterase 2 isoform X2 [Theropithecus gelada]|uniref:sphingomyelin phosphodiesterase 2 isoform X2 n=1 Tax=Theropithecus gelada TaxID=9565 RepID=UPI000DC16160|nr:sphingomyelin phosphodiesterase 2 isoform X2 [Theropithecus gelada]
MKPNFSLRLRIFNLNCWGIPYLSKHRADRMRRLGDFLNQESFDLALLEEVWSEQDFQYLRQKLSPTYPAAHHFRSGIIGSGLCVFSKHPIQELTQHVYTLNGYPYMIHHGDWFSGKAVGLLVLHLSGMVLNAYVTHLHAEYNRQKDIYLAHRVAQAWELAQFIQCVSLGLNGEVGWDPGAGGEQGPSHGEELVREELPPHQRGSPSHTSKKADVVLLCGDLNMHPEDLGCCLLKEWTGLRDAYLETRDFKGSEEGNTMVPKNCYVSQQELKPFPFGVRIDYMLYKAVSGFYISCKSLETTTGNDPYSGTPLSDHEALMATLFVRHSPPQQSPHSTHRPAERSPLMSVLKEAWTELGLGMAQARWWAAFASYVIGLGLLLLALLCVLAAGGGAREAAILLWTPSVGLVLWAGAFYLFHVQEVNGLYRAHAELQHVLGRAREAQDLGPEPQPALLLGQQEGDRTKEQ